MSKRLPDHIRDKVIALYAQGKLEEEIAICTGLSDDKLSEALNYIRSSENEHANMDHIVLNLHNIGSDLADYQNLIDAKKILIQQNISRSQASWLIANFAEFSGNKVRSPEALIHIFKHYGRVAGCEIKSFDELLKKSSMLADALTSLNDEERSLRERRAFLMIQLNELE
jgi:hypothetical protein